MLSIAFNIFKYLFLLIFFANYLQAEEITDIKTNTNNSEVSRKLKSAFEHLLAHTDQSSTSLPDPQQIDQVIAFVSSSKDPKNTYNMGERNGAASSYYEFFLNRPLKNVLNLVYNPDIPSHIVIPASIRRSEWIKINGKQQKLPKLSDHLDNLSAPILIKGIEFIENTPDTYSGAYYAYELDRALLLTRHKGHIVLISISRQRNKSDVGKKGVVLGNDDNWDYLYTDEKGCSKAGLGWVSSYMYDSASIAVYYEEKGATPRVRCGIFKWLRAGWAGINMVKPHHIRDGVKRFAGPFKNIVESPILADTKMLTHKLRQINRLPENELRNKVQRYYLYLKDIHKNQNRVTRQWFDQLSGNDGLLTNMNRKEMKAFLQKAYVKHLLGKNPEINIRFFAPMASNTSLSKNILHQL